MRSRRAGKPSLAAVFALLLGAACPAGAQEGVGFGIQRVAPPGVARNVVSDAVQFVQTYQYWIGGILVFLVLRWIWRDLLGGRRRD